MSGEALGNPGAYSYEGELRIAPALVERLVQLSRDALPHEACGLLAGGQRHASAVYPLTNTAASAERYEVDPREQLDAYNDIAERGLDAIGVYHSHPATPARPSATDVAEAYDPEAVYLIVSLAAEAPSVRAFSIREGAVTELHLHITDAAEAVAERKDD